MNYVELNMIQGCFLSNIPLELIHNRYSGSLNKPFELNKFEFLSRSIIIPISFLSVTSEGELKWPNAMALP